MAASAMDVHVSEQAPLERIQRIALGDSEVLICDAAMVRAFELLKRLARTDLAVLVIGETGVGKENAAQAVHHFSTRRDQPFVAINCAALPEALIESELFGHNRGAFTGATSERIGLFESASGGTLFLDEVGELALTAQAKLLRALETRRITRIGDAKERRVDVRIVAATNRVLDTEVKAGRFRQDLYFRFGIAHVHLLPLRERRDEIPMLFRAFLGSSAARAGRTPPDLAPAVMHRLLAYDWPGNVRELKAVADYISAVIDGDRIELDDLPAQLAPPRVADYPVPAAGPASPMRRLADELEALERQRIAEALTSTGGVKTRAARLLGMPIRTFNVKIRRYGLRSPAPGPKRDH